MSKRWGSSHPSLSKLPVARLVTTSVPAGNSTSRYSMSSAATLAVARTAPRWRIVSSTAPAARSGSAPSRSHWSGYPLRRATEQASWLRVVSVPAMSTASVIITNSSVVSRSPSSSAAMRSLRRSSAGRLRRASTMART